MYRTIFLFSLLTYILCSYAQPQNSSNKEMISTEGPFNWIPQNRSLGPIIIGEEAEFTFWLTNTTDRVVIIKDVEVSHKDVEAYESQRRIRPNEVAYITAKVRPTSEGKLKASIRVHTDYGDHIYSLALQASCYRRR